jgi:hypothetical protein
VNILTEETENHSKLEKTVKWEASKSLLFTKYEYY